MVVVGIRGSDARRDRNKSHAIVLFATTMFDESQTIPRQSVAGEHLSELQDIMNPSTFVAPDLNLALPRVAIEFCDRVSESFSKY